MMMKRLIEQHYFMIYCFTNGIVAGPEVNNRFYDLDWAVEIKHWSTQPIRNVLCYSPYLKCSYLLLPGLSGYISTDMETNSKLFWFLGKVPSGKSSLKGPYNANSTFIVLLYVHMRSWHVSQPTNAWKKQFTLLVVIPRCQTRYG